MTIIGEPVPLSRRRFLKFGALTVAALTACGGPPLPPPTPTLAPTPTSLPPTENPLDNPAKFIFARKKLWPGGEYKLPEDPEDKESFRRQDFSAMPVLDLPAGFNELSGESRTQALNQAVEKYCTGTLIPKMLGCNYTPLMFTALELATSTLAQGENVSPANERKNLIFSAASFKEVFKDSDPETQNALGHFETLVTPEGLIKFRVLINSDKFDYSQGKPDIGNAVHSDALWATVLVHEIWGHREFATHYIAAYKQYLTANKRGLGREEIEEIRQGLVVDATHNEAYAHWIEAGAVDGMIQLDPDLQKVVSRSQLDLSMQRRVLIQAASYDKDKNWWYGADWINLIQPLLARGYEVSPEKIAILDRYRIHQHFRNHRIVFDPDQMVTVA